MLQLVAELGSCFGFPRQRQALVATPELVELGYLGNAAAGPAVTETGQRGADLHTCDYYGALDGFA